MKSPVKTGPTNFFTDASSGGGYGVPAVSFTNPTAPSTPAVAGAAPGSGGSSPSVYTPDWSSLIANDAGLKDALATLNAGAASDAASRNAQITNAYENFGKPVDLSQLAQQLGMSQADIQNALGPDAQKIAQENTAAGLSTVARLDQANTKANRQIIQDLNKRGILNSGETPYQLDQENLSYRQAQQDAYQKFLGYLQQYQQGYLTAQQQRAAALAQAYSAAADRQYGLYSGGGGGGGQSAAPAPSAASPQENQLDQTVAQAIQNYGPSPEQRVRFIGY